MNFGLVVCVALCQDYSGKNVCFCCLAGMKMLVGHLELSEQIQIWTLNLVYLDFFLVCFPFSNFIFHAFYLH